MQIRLFLLVLPLALAAVGSPSAAAYECPEGTILTQGKEKLHPGDEAPPESAEWCQRPDGTRHGRWISWHENGTTSAAGDFLDGEMDGWWVFWYPSGKKQREVRYTSGWQDGDVLEWDEFGKLIGQDERPEDVEVVAEEDPQDPAAPEATRAEPDSSSRPTVATGLRRKHMQFLLDWSLKKLEEEEAASSPDRERILKLLRRAARCLRELGRTAEAEEYDERASQLERSAETSDESP